MHSSAALLFTVTASFNARYCSHAGIPTSKTMQNAMVQLAAYFTHQGLPLKKLASPAATLATCVP
jgi:hypothetical protein